MKKLLLLVVVVLLSLAAGCDREKFAAHRAERSKPKVAVGQNSLMVRRAPYPNIEILPDGRMKVDDIEIPLDDAQRQLLQHSFVQLQILRQNTLADRPAGQAAQRSVPIIVPANMQPFPPELVKRIPEFKDYGDALANPRAEP
ncbi:hypothetical protein [Stenotrophomonas sp. YIM B06876]|uniref:hypothetical protein n=1 Tax=Stenotrophomonas sp. YIM B06876 TaxID=3060211 RepID=UPI00273A42B6|nr:hypothetical protein [Stenotrophomonas sp. YIM B06876]